jgi:prepilin-type processing-associated H-X9-DG protein
VAFLAILLALLFPTFQTVRAEALAVSCAANLHGIGLGFVTYKRTYPQEYFHRTSVYPVDLAWPGVPGKLISEWDLFRCPAEAKVSTGGGVLEFHSQEGWSAPFGESNVCKVHRGPGPSWGNGAPPTPADTSDYAFEDVGGPNSATHGDADYDDCVIRIVDKAEEGAVIFGSAAYSNAIYSYGQLLFQIPPIWGMVDPPLTFPIPSGFTNYGYNSKMGVQGSDATIVAVDYPRAVANRPGEDVGTLLGQALRHLGQVNVLYSDGGVRRRSFSQLDPALEANREAWGNVVPK